MANSSQLPKGFFITGTDTGVGKTVVTVCLLHHFKNLGIQAGAMKPVETGVIINGKESDSEFLIRVGNLDDSIEDVSPYRLRAPAAPLIAGQMENISIDTRRIQKSFKVLEQKHQTVLVEGIGGLLVPINEDYLVADLARDLALPLIVVSRPVLGTINHTLMTLESAKKQGVNVKGIVINHCSEDDGGEIQEKSLEFIKAYSDVPVIGHLPWFPNIIPDISTKSFIKKLGESLSSEKLLHVS
tara:strand:+ start:1989 stop:2714 length:726 start_codon:yes stop_codon:yes gene_type:complete